jgi:hypothetical protein
MSSDIKEVIELAKKEPIREFDFNKSDIRYFYTVLLETSNEMANWFGLDAGDFLLASSRVTKLLRSISAFNNKPSELYRDYSACYQNYFKGSLGRFSIFEHDIEDCDYAVVGNSSRYLYIKVNNLKK